jgi:Glycosyl transferase family 2
VVRPISLVNSAWTQLRLLWRQGLRLSLRAGSLVGWRFGVRLRETSKPGQQAADGSVASIHPSTTVQGADPFDSHPPFGSQPRPCPQLHAPLRACASVVIPALNEAKRIASVVKHALADAATAEVIVIDDSSIDDTAALARAAGATVYTSSMLGKGASMQDGVGVVNCDLVVFLDGDLAGLRSGIITDLCRPLVRDEADFVKARFGRSGGRVTELTAKPMLKVFFPELAHFKQPLGGIIAAPAS